jgi:hypothetical protein
MIDPARSARMLASALEGDQTAVALMPEGRVLPLQGDLAPELLISDPPGQSLVDWVTSEHPKVPAFLWPRSPRGWYRLPPLRVSGRGARALRPPDADHP